MKSLHLSDSSEQRLAEKEILDLVNKHLSLNLIHKTLVINKTTFQLDGYSENPPIFCEIYARIGKLKPAQKNKINKDILKMLLIGKMQRKPFRKIIAFVDEDAAKSFSGGKSWYSKLKDYFGIEFFVIKISGSLLNKLVEAQKRQYR